MVNHKTVLTTTLIRLGVYLFIWPLQFDQVGTNNAD